MPRGVPVGTLAIGTSGAANAAILALRFWEGSTQRSVRPWLGFDRLDRCGRRVADMAHILPLATTSGKGTLSPPASLGVIGSGQLGRMFIQAAQRMGYRAGVSAPPRKRRRPRLRTGE